MQDVGDERMGPATDGVASCRRREGGEEMGLVDETR